jgi:hypothetical protein
MATRNTYWKMPRFFAAAFFGSNPALPIGSARRKTQRESKDDRIVDIPAVIAEGVGGVGTK